MSVWENAVTVSVLGSEIYLYGLYVMIGVIAFAITLSVLSGTFRMKKGTAALQLLLSLLLGGIASRIGYCLMTQELGEMMSVSAWVRGLHGGGWSLYPLLAGVFAAASAAGGITGENNDDLLDNAACALPLFVAAERFAESVVPDFNVSRPLKEDSWLAKSFLALQDTYGSYLRTYYLAAAAALVLFVVLLLYRKGTRRASGDTFIAFLLVFGAGGIFLESLRYDYFLSISFVRLEQILAAVTLFIGCVLAARKGETHGKAFRVLVPVSVFVMAGICIGIEFALDRTDINHYLLYAGMLIVVALPAAAGLRLLNPAGRKDRVAA